MAFDVFISYSHKDRDRRDELANHLSNLRGQELIADWFDGDIVPGKEWKKEILDRLNTAHVILLLISSDFMASEFCSSIELKRAIERHDANEARVIPIIVRPTYWDGAPFAKLAVLPTDGKPISRFSQEDDAYLDIVLGIKRALTDLQENPPPSQPAETITTTPVEPTQKVSEELASIFYVPFQRNLYFTGRETILEQLHHNFSASHKETQPQAIRGLGGVGKTQLALEYAHRFRAEYRYIFWVRANSHEQLVSDYVTIANLLNLILRNNTDQMLTVAEVKEWLRTHDSWLLILDNADDIKMVKSFLPSSTMGHILLTTRTPIAGTAIQEHELRSMDLEEGTLFLLRRAKLLPREALLDVANDQDRHNAAKIVEVLGALPLALAQAGAYIEEKGCGLAGYSERYQKRRLRLLQEKGEVEHDPVATTWSLSFTEIEQDDTAADLLRLCAFLHPDAIPEQLIVDGAQALSTPLQTLAEDIFELDDAVDKLKKYSLVRRNDDGKTLNIHRLVQAVLKDNMDEDAQRLWAQRTVQAVNLAFPKPSTETRQWCQQLIPHAQVCTALMKQWHIEASEAFHLLELAGQYLHEYGQYQEAEAIVQQLHDIQERLYGKDHLDVAHTLNTLGELAREQAHYQQAQTLYQRALSIRQELLDPQDPDVATSLNNLARSYHHFAQHSQAAELYEQALAIREEALGQEHPDVAHSLNDLAVLYEAQGKYQEALPLFLRALAIREQVLGPQHPDTAMSLNNLADFYKLQGKYQEALPLFLRALAIREQVLGPQHPDTAVSLNKLAELYQDQGKYQQALPLFLRDLAISEKVLGPQHPHTAESLDRLATLYQAQGKYQQALPLFQRALKIYEQVLGSEHPSRAASLNNLALLYQDQGKYQQALPLLQKALAIHEQVLGSEHSDTATNLNNLAGFYQAQGKYQEALPLYQRALAIREQVLGPEHPATATSLNNLAGLYQAQGKYQEALPLYQRALKIYEQVLGPQHPYTATSLNSLAELYQAQGKYQEALPLFQRSLAINEQVLGPIHPHTANGLNSLALLYKDQRRMLPAITSAKKALATSEKVLGPKHPDVAATLNTLGLIYTSQNNFKHAEPAFQRALSICMQSLGPEHPTTATILINYAFMLKKAKRNKKAEEMEAQAEAIRVKLGQEPLQTEQES